MLSTRSWLSFQRITPTLLAFVVLIVAITIAEAAYDSCSPINCSTSCTPNCSADQVCVVGTMTTCGVCPQSKCVSREALGLASTGSQQAINNSDNNHYGSSASSSDTNGSDSHSNGALIGGILGGLLGGGALLCLLGYFMIIRPVRKRRKSNTQLNARLKDTKPTTTHGNTTFTTEQRQKEDEEAGVQHPSLHPARLNSSIYNYDRDSRGHRPQMSGIIPVTFVPLTHSNRTTTTLSRLSALNALHQSILNNSEHEENPFHDRQSIVTSTTLSTIQHHAPNPYNDTVMSQSRRASMESDMSSQLPSSTATATTTATATIMAQATQVIRAKPQIMRVNTINQHSSSATRKVSIKRSARPPEHSNMDSDDKAKEENPFDDKNKVSTTTTAAASYKATTDSVLSTPGDGEITIIWHAN